MDVRDSLNVYVDVTAGINVLKNEIFWIFESIDPETNLPTEDALTGFLPVNDTTITLYNDTITKKGEGFVNYTISPQKNLQTGDTIKGQASIIFDINAPLLTNTWVNLIDALPPTSTMDTLAAAVVPGNMVRLDWQGEDDSGGVGVDVYDLYVAKDSGAYFLIAENIDTTLYEFQGSEGSEYFFYTRATDYVGNVEGEKYVLDEQILLGVQDSIAILHPSLDTMFCASDSLILAWEVFGGVELVNIHLSNDAGTSFLMPIDTLTIEQSPFKFPLAGLAGTNFVLRFSDKTSNGYTVLSDTFSIIANDTTMIEMLACNVNEVGNTYTATDAGGNIKFCDVNVTITDPNDVCGSNCQGVDLEKEEVPIPERDYMASNSITSSGTVNANTSVSFRAGNTITLQPGFHAAQASEFLAQIGDCDPASLVESVEVNNVAKVTEISQPFSLLDDIKVKIIPNPFFGNTTIQFNLGQSEVLDILVHDLTGKQIAILAKETFFEKGQRQYNFDATGQLPGMYLLTPRTADKQIVKKMILMQ